MQQFQSLQRLLIFYTLSLTVMLLLYYVTMFDGMKKHSEQHSIDTFYSLQHSIIEHAAPVDSEIKKILEQPTFDQLSYQLILMMPSGQTYIHHNTRPNESAFSTVAFPTIGTSASSSSDHSSYTVNSNELTGIINLKSGHQIYIVLRHEPFVVDWISYRYWLPLMVAIVLFFMALLYMLNRRTNWEQLLVYTDNLSSRAKESYTPPPFLQKKSTTEFMLLGHALSRVSYQLHNDYRRIKTLSHRLERLVDQAPLPMLMSIRHGQISFYNQRFEQVFTPPTQREQSYELTDFVEGKDEATQILLKTISSLRVTRTLIVYGLENKQAYQLHVTPWFGEHGQVHGFTVIFNNVDEIFHQSEQLQLHNKQLQLQIDESNEAQAFIGRKLRIPLEKIIDSLEPIDPSTLTAQGKKTLNTLITTSQSMLTVLNETLATEEVEVRKTRLSIETVDIYKVSKEVSNLVTQEIRQQGLELIYFFAPDCPRYIETDYIRLHHILLNLLKNAISFTTSGYVALTVDRVSEDKVTRISNQHSTPNNDTTMPAQTSYWIRCSVKDTGATITPERKNQLVNILNQSNHNLVEDSNIGLSDANSFAQLLGGFIELSNTVDKETIFSLYLPYPHATYQSVYHRCSQLPHIHLIAIINQPLVAEHLQRLCEYLTISVTIYSTLDRATVQQLKKQLKQDEQTIIPVLLLDYEYSQSITSPVHASNKHSEQQEALNDLVATPSLPKILLSMKLERHIPSTLLGQYDGFLTKPLDASLLLSELLRLTLFARKTLNILVKHQYDSSLSFVEDIPKKEILSPLILVVEDSPTNQKIACKMLSKLGYRSIVAEDGQQALEKLKSRREEISLILMDCRMPVMDGLQATQVIRSQGDKIPIVALTANNTEEDREACMQVGMDEFLSKPISKKDLESVLQSFIQ
ncbi:hybrid sensor histidine kinase/response regulator [Psychrobacter sp. P11G3]|uniref:response regulator n=1 Tax=Psychrobacter sp. P11G3 TaxID=1699623 RepID=UPI00071040DA|nr:hybrid sensor histidine kinase/response regulator [Psychrobacter sp. P11G3]KRG33349.1 histidine kinase [Psychrobacter sp. P11G3]